MTDFQKEILAGIPDVLPAKKEYDKRANHAPKRKDILTDEEKKLALANALRYFPEKHHAELAPEFLEELKQYGRIYMYRLRHKEAGGGLAAELMCLLGLFPHAADGHIFGSLH